MSDIISRIHDDMDRYEGLCAKFREKPVLGRDGQIDPYSKHSKKLEKRLREEDPPPKRGPDPYFEPAWELERRHQEEDRMSARSAPTVPTLPKTFLEEVEEALETVAKFGSARFEVDPTLDCIVLTQKTAAENPIRIRIERVFGAVAQVSPPKKRRLRQ